MRAASTCGSGSTAGSTTCCWTSSRTPRRSSGASCTRWPARSRRMEPASEPSSASVTSSSRSTASARRSPACWPSFRACCPGSSQRRSTRATAPRRWSSTRSTGSSRAWRTTRRWPTRMRRPICPGARRWQEGFHEHTAAKDLPGATFLVEAREKAPDERNDDTALLERAVERAVADLAGGAQRHRRHPDARAQAHRRADPPPSPEGCRRERRRRKRADRLGGRAGLRVAPSPGRPPRRQRRRLPRRKLPPGRGCRPPEGCRPRAPARSVARGSSSAHR